MNKVSKTAPILPNGLPDWKYKCGDNSPYHPENIRHAKMSVGERIHFNLIARFKV